MVTHTDRQAYSGVKIYCSDVQQYRFKSATELKPISSGYSFKQCLDYTLESWWTPSSEAIFSLVHIHLYFALVLLNISSTLHEGGRFKLTD